METREQGKIGEGMKRENGDAEGEEKERTETGAERGERRHKVGMGRFCRDSPDWCQLWAPTAGH